MYYNYKIIKKLVYLENETIKIFNYLNFIINNFKASYSYLYKTIYLNVSIQIRKSISPLIVIFREIYNFSRENTFLYFLE